MDILHSIEDLGQRVINPALAIEKTVNKYYTSSILENNNLSTPKTFATEDFTAAMDFFETHQDVVLKPLFGSLGKGMVRITDEDTAYRVMKAWDFNNLVFYLQKFIPHKQEDIRVFTAGGEVLGAMRRKGEGWKTNVARGAKVEAVELAPNLEELALKAAEVLGLDYAGVDIILRDGDMNKPYIIEVNGIPGWLGLQEAMQASIADQLVDQLID
jgi:RimK family alpha-L-glutamate ligase